MAAENDNVTMRLQSEKQQQQRAQALSRDLRGKLAATREGVVEHSYAVSTSAESLAFVHDRFFWWKKKASWTAILYYSKDSGTRG